MSRRLHPAAFLVHALGGLQDVVVPLILALVLGARSPGMGTLIALLAVGASLVIGYARWAATRYWIDDDALHFRSGVFSPDTQVVPIARITAVDEVQGPVQRAFGVVALHVQTAGGGEGGEIELTAVARPEAVRVREALGHPARPELEAEAEEYRLSPRRLLLVAVTGPQLGVVAPIVGGALAVAQQAIGPEAVDRLPDTAHGWTLLVLVVVAGVVVLSLLGAVVAFGGFVVRREPDRLRIQRGLLQRRAATLALSRVHAIRVVEGVLRGPLGFCSVYLEVAGYAKEQAAARTLVPLCRRSELRELLARLVPELPLPTGPAQRPPARALRRYLLPPGVSGVAFGALAATVAAVAGAPVVVWAAPVVGLALGLALGFGRWRGAGWWARDGIVALRRRPVVARVTTVALVRRLQHRELSASLPARRADLASVGFAVASGSEAAVEHLDAPVARGLFARLGVRQIAGGPERAGLC